MNLHAKPYALTIDQGYNDAGEVYDIEVLSTTATLNVIGDLGISDFRNWCNTNNVYYYGRPAADFSEAEALDLAANACATFLLMDNMS